MIVKLWDQIDSKMKLTRQYLTKKLKKAVGAEKLLAEMIQALGKSRTALAEVC